MTACLFPVDISHEEHAFGFLVIPAPWGLRTVAVADVGGGLRAVKVRSRSGKTLYLVCDEVLCPRSATFDSLDALVARFPRR